jgi:hypothetical protein
VCHSTLPADTQTIPWKLPNGVCRILSLDGGGIWSLIQVKCLLAIYGNVRGHQLLSHFDLVAGTSGGAIVLGGLLLNWSLEQILAHFLDTQWRRRMFQQHRKSRVQRLISAVAGLFTFLAGLPIPRWDAQAKLAFLQELMGSPGGGDTPHGDGRGSGASVHVHAATRMHHLPTRCIIVSFDLDTRRQVLFRSYRSALASDMEYDTTLAEAIHASSTAPVRYFDQPAFVHVDGKQRRYWDGAISGLQTPVLAAIVEAMANGVALHDMRVLSLGTGTVKLPASHHHHKADSPDLLSKTYTDSALGLHDLEILATSILDDVPEFSATVAHVVLGNMSRQQGHEASLVRLSPLLQPWFNPKTETWEYPRAFAGTEAARTQFVHLTHMELDSVAEADVQLLSKVADLWISGALPNEPIRSHRDTLVHEVGFETFRQGATAWRLHDPCGAHSLPTTTT